MNAGEYLASLSGLPSGSALEHLMAIRSGGSESAAQPGAGMAGVYMAGSAASNAAQTLTAPIVREVQIEVPVERIVEVPVEVIVERVIERTVRVPFAVAATPLPVDLLAYPEHNNAIAALEASHAAVTAAQDQIIRTQASQLSGSESEAARLRADVESLSALLVASL